MLEQSKKYFAGSILLLILSILVLIGVNFLEEAGRTGEVIGVILMVLDLVLLVGLSVLTIISFVKALQNEKITFYGFHITNVVINILMFALFFVIFFI